LLQNQGPLRVVLSSKRDEYLQRTELLKFHATLDEALKADVDKLEAEAVRLYVKAGEVCFTSNCLLLAIIEV